MSNNLKKVNKSGDNPYKDYLPENRFANENGGTLFFLRVLIVLLIVFIVGGYYYFSHSEESNILKTESRYYNLNLAESIDLNTIYSDSDVVWETSSKNVSIDNGYVTGISPGVAYIIARKGNQQVSDVNITVLDNNKDMSIEEHSIQVNVGEEHQIKVNRPDKSESGNVGSNSGGKPNNNDVSNNDVEIVNSPSVIDNFLKITNPDGITDSNNNVSNNGNDNDLDVVNPNFSNDSSNDGVVETVDNNDYHEDLVFESSNPRVASVDDSGNIQPVSEGTTVVTVTDVSGNEDYTYVTVVEVDDITISVSEYSLEVGDTALIGYSVNENKFSKDDVSFSSDDVKIASVDNNGKISANGKGNAVISAKVGNTTKNIRVIVKEKIILPTGISLGNDKMELTVGDSGKINASVVPSNATSLYLGYKSSNGNIVSVDDDGNVKAKAVGEANVTVTTSNSISKVVHVKVNRRVVEATDISFDQSNLKLNVGDTAKISYTITPIATTDKSVDYTYDRNYISLDNSGNIKALQAGSTQIVVTTKNGHSSTLHIEIISPVKKASEIKINEGNLKLVNGNQKQLTFTVNPSDVDTSLVSWNSSNNNVVSVDNKGLIKAKAVGKAIITVQLDGKKSSIEVEVTSNIISVKKLVLNKKSATLKTGWTYSELKVSFEPSNATNKNVLWKSSNNNIVTVDNKGVVVAHGVGTATVTAVSAENSNISAECVFKVNYKIGLQIDYTSKSLSLGDSYTFKANVTPKEANQSVRWESSNKNIAVVDNNGKVKAVGVGEAIITATSVADSNVKQSVKVTVLAAKTNLENIKNAVGIHYTTWFNPIMDTTPKISTKSKLEYSHWYYWGEPAVGFYRSDDKAVIRKHMKMLSDAGVDFIILDNTNANTAWKNCYSWYGNTRSKTSYWTEMISKSNTALFETMLEMNAEGLKTPKVVNWIYTYNGSLSAVNAIYSEFYTKDKYKSLWLYYGGKPFILTTSSVNVGSNFTSRKMWGLEPSKGRYVWSFLERYNTASTGNEQISVSVAMQQTYMDVSTALCRRNGKTFHEQWQRAFNAHPKVVTITWWNEWAAIYVQVGNTGHFTDNYNTECSRDIEPMKGGHGDKYYKLMKLYIQHYKNGSSIKSYNWYQSNAK